MSEYSIQTIDLEFQGKESGIAAFLIETNDGPILVETGPHSALPVLEAEIKKKGFHPSDIQHVFITHIHLDHAGASWCFAENGARIYLHPRGFRHMHDPSRLLASAKMIYKDEMDSLWGTLKPISEDLLVTVEHLEVVEVYGLKFQAHHTPGHAQHHIAWQLDDQIFTGDVAGVSINGGPVIPPCPPPDINIEVWLSSIDHLLGLEEVSTYYLTHFGKVSNIIPHMNKLRGALHDYSEFARPIVESGKSVEESLPKFRNFVREFLVEHGLASQDAAAYEAANPSDMSLTGLMRYWKKKLDQ